LLIELNKNGKFFSEAELRELIPIIHKITKSYKSSVDQKMVQLEYLSNGANETSFEIEKQVDEMINEWKQKMLKLGAKPAGLWVLDFDSGSDYFCWKYPEEHVLYRHGYMEGFTSRKPL